jgi:hypothetical protein
MARATPAKSADSRSACSWVRTFAVGPTGMSIRAWVAPAVFFLARIDATSCASVSIPIGRSTVMSTSSAGARSRAPPHTMQPPVASTTRWILDDESSTSASTAIVSAVPEGLVMAREEVLGTTTPRDARIGTTTMVVRLPGMPPMQCLSATGPDPKSSCAPQWIMAFVNATSSSASSRRKAHASTNIVSSTFE